MKTALVYLTRFILGGAGCALILMFCYRGVGGSDKLRSYLVTCSLLALISLVACLLRIRGSRIGAFLSAAAIAFIISFGLIALSGAIGPVDGMPWQYFYKDDYLLAFIFIAPFSLALLAGLLTLIPERKRVS